MPWWGLVCGLLIGVAGNGLDNGGWFVSGIAGLLMGVWLQSLIRNQIAAGKSDLLDEIEARLQASVPAPTASVSPPIATPRPESAAAQSMPRPAAIPTPAADPAPMRPPPPIISP